MTLQELAELVEGAEGPSRELDSLILTAAFGYIVEARQSGDDYFYNRIDRMGRLRVPSYTASLDAAMTLVPRGWLVSILRGFDDDGEYFAFIELTDSFTVGRGADPEEEVSVRARRGARKTFEDPTALALCAAALRAIARAQAPAPETGENPA